MDMEKDPPMRTQDGKHLSHYLHADVPWMVQTIEQKRWNSPKQEISVVLEHSDSSQSDHCHFVLAIDN